MEVIATLIRVTVPNYLKNLPIPSSIMGIAKLSGQEWLQLLPVVGTLSLLAYVTYNAFKAKPEPKNTKVNLKIQKESSKVVNMVDIEELGDKVSYCRCWRSKKLFKDIYVRGHQGPASSDTRLNTGFLYVMAAITNIMKNVVIMLGPLF